MLSHGRPHLPLAGRASGQAVDVDSSLPLPRRPHSNSRLRGDARSGDGGVREVMATAIGPLRRPSGPVLFPFFRSELVRSAHQAVAEALHIHLALVAAPVSGFGDLLASQLAAYLF